LFGRLQLPKPFLYFYIGILSSISISLLPLFLPLLRCSSPAFFNSSSDFREIVIPPGSPSGRSIPGQPPPPPPSGHPLPLSPQEPPSPFLIKAFSSIGTFMFFPTPFVATCFFPLPSFRPFQRQGQPADLLETLVAELVFFRLVGVFLSFSSLSFFLLQQFIFPLSTLNSLTQFYICDPPFF